MKMQFRNKFLLFVSIKQKLEDFSAYLLDRSHFGIDLVTTANH